MSLPAYRAADPARTYYAFNGVWAYLSALTFTLSLVYQIKEVGLSPLQLVLVGTTLEIACFVFEIPTGIVADLYSRRLSVIIGFVLIGAGFLLQGLVPAFLAILAAQVLWGLGFTFTSGAEQAWITDEVGEERVSRVFVRSQQISLGCQIAGTVSAGVLGVISLSLPMKLSGAGMIVMALVLLVVMREQNFHPTPRAERETFRQMAETFKHGLAVARRRPVVRTLVLISLVSGLSSEAFDRLWSVKILDDFQFPDLFGTTDPAVWFAVFSLVGTLLSLAASLIVNRVSAERVNALHPNGLLALLAFFQLDRVRARRPSLARTGGDVVRHRRGHPRVPDRVRLAEPQPGLEVAGHGDLDGVAGERHRPGRRRSPARRPGRRYLDPYRAGGVRADPVADPAALSAVAAGPADRSTGC
jgi:DHA3 family tetracycline resistance protein-like MFS transporter